MLNTENYKVKSLKKQGFTIVELLVVIVVIGILATITVVSYTGITTKANTATNKQNASSVLAAAQTFYTDSSTFPATDATSATVYTNFNVATNVAKLPAGLTINNVVLAAGSTIRYLLNAAGTGVCVTYWDYSGSGAKVSLFGGVATADSNAGATAASCT